MAIPLKSTKTALTIGFTIVLILMTLLMISGINVLNSNLQRLEILVHNNNLKTDLLTKMRTAARERTVSLQKMLTLDDPFEKDDEWMKILARGTDFIVARDKLLSLRLSKEEKYLLDNFLSIVRDVGPLQAEVAHLILDDNYKEGQALLVNKAAPLQNTAFQEITKILQLQKENAEMEVQQAKLDYNHTLMLMFIISVAVISVSIFIAFIVIRRSSDAEKRLYNEKERALVTLYSIGEGVIVCNTDGNIESMNYAAEEITGWRNEIAEGLPIHRVLQISGSNQNSAIFDPVNNALDNQEITSSEQYILLLRKDMSEYAIEHTSSPIRDQYGNIIGVVVVFRDVTGLQALTKQLEYQAQHDPLTGLYNRYGFENNLEQAIDEVRKGSTIQHWFCYIDLDQFKVINDTCGHQAGDELLKQLAIILRNNITQDDIAVRMGGDEFAILMKNTTEHDALNTADLIRMKFEEHQFTWDMKSFSCSASIGLVEIAPDSGNAAVLLSSADAACFVAKGKGRNRIHTFKRNDDDTSTHQGEMEWVHKINHALEHNRFILYAQQISPTYDDSLPTIYEVLIRLIDDENSIISPMSFIPAAERYNLMSKIDRWVISNTFSILHNSKRHDIPETDHHISINLSSQSLSDDGFLQFILEKLSEYSIDPSLICFEITETCAIANLTRATELINYLKGKGCTFALDDFGSGLSSFGYLKKLPIDYLKIDGNFIRNILEDKMDAAFVRSINQIGHILNIKTVAEYVDNPDKITLLESIGVDYIQGFEIHKPESLIDILNSLRLEVAASS